MFTTNACATALNTSERRRAGVLEEYGRLAGVLKDSLTYGTANSDRLSFASESGSLATCLAALASLVRDKLEHAVFPTSRYGALA